MKYLTLATFLFVGLMSFTLIDGTGYQIGDTVEDFSLGGVDGENITLSNYMGEGGAVVIFTCNTCPWAVGYEDRIQDLHTTLSEKRLACSSDKS